MGNLVMEGSWFFVETDKFAGGAAARNNGNGNRESEIDV
jgi:hypothetical protein